MMVGMDLLAQPLRNLLAQTRDVLREATSRRVFEGASDDELADQLGVVAELGRFAEALLLGAAGR